jgi:hypothetical protein
LSAPVQNQKNSDAESNVIELKTETNKKLVYTVWVYLKGIITEKTLKEESLQKKKKETTITIIIITTIIDAQLLHILKLFDFGRTP